MRAVLAAAVLVGSLAATATPADACSIRGRWCGYPLWAANAFEDPEGRVNPGSAPVLNDIGRERRYYGPPRRYAEPRYERRRQAYRRPAW